MYVASFSTASNGCKLSISPSTDTYIPGQAFTVTISSPTRLAFKAVALGGATISNPRGGILSTSTCADFNSLMTSSTFTLNAPTTGGSPIQVKAICGSSTIMNVADDIILQPVRISPSKIVVAPEFSTDPAFTYQRTLDTKTVLFFKANSTHCVFKMTSSFGGYISFGVSSAIISSYALIGMDPTYNPGYNPVALYQLKSKTGSNNQIAVLVAGPSTLSTYGISGASFSVVSGVSTLVWTMEIANQVSSFTLVPVKPSFTNVTYAVGPPAFSLHNDAGVLEINFFNGSSTTNVSSAPTPITSSDPNYPSEVVLNPSMTLFYKLNSTYLALRLSMNSSGYVALGTGLTMIGSTSIVGMDPTQNPGFPAVGLYKLNSKTATPSQVMTMLASTSAELQNYGIYEASFTSTSNAADLRWTMKVSSQQSSFLLASTSSPVDVFYAGGPVTFSLHNFQGSISGLSFSSQSLSGGPTGGSTYNVPTLLAVHILAGIVSWAVFAPFGGKLFRGEDSTSTHVTNTVVIPLFNNIKHGSPLCGFSAQSWLRYHYILLTTGVIISLIAGSAGYFFVTALEIPHLATTHEQTGAFVVVLSIFQLCYGYCRPKSPNSTFQMIHPLIGYLLFLAGLAACLLGMAEFDNISGSQPYTFLGTSGTPGFTGSLGAMIVIMCSAWFLSLIVGLVRAFCISSPWISNEKGIGEEIPFSDVNKHNNEHDCWVIYRGEVYNITGFLNLHPGGKGAILQSAGRDVTQPFDTAGHSNNARTILNRYYVGTLAQSLEELIPANVSTAIEKVDVFQSSPRFFLLNGSKQEVTLIEKSIKTHNVILLKFALPNPTQVLGLPIGKHITVYGPSNIFVHQKERGKWNGKAESNASEIQRNYTPISNDETDVGYFTLLVKVYRPCPQFQDGGRMSRYLDSLKQGDSVMISGPVGPNQYLGNGIFFSGTRKIAFTKLGMIAGGTGITPMFQIANAILKNPDDPVKISILYANSTVEDVLMQEELQELERRYPQRIRVWYTVSRNSGYDWGYDVGRINKDMVMEHIPAASNQTLILTCGPRPMIAAIGSILQQLYYSNNMWIDY